jgi:UDP-2-acetamido-3-amino-2,3-dideoxy-glucuronate N-acetyltransferase
MIPNLFHSSVKIGKGTKIEPTAVLQEGCEIGIDCFVGHYTIMRPNTIIGNRTKVGHLCVFEGETRVGEDCVIQSQCHITKGAIIEDKVFFGPGTIGINDLKMTHLRHGDEPFIPNAFKVKQGARVATGVLIAPGVTIGRNAVIGMGSIVMKDVEDNEIVYGTKAQIRGVVPEGERL